MSGARDDIFARLHGTLAAGGTTEERRAQAAARLAQPPRVAAPGRVQNVDLVAAFCARAEEVGATTARIGARTELGAAVAEYLRARNLGTDIKLSPELAAKDIAWPETLTLTHGRASGEDMVGIALARVGVAETGTLVLASGAHSPTTLNFLPETHIVVMASSRVVGTYEEGWDRVRGSGQDNKLLPRAVNWITGPSRTADIEQTILTGVHGPKRLHIIVVDDEP